MTLNEVKTVIDSIDDFIEIPEGITQLKQAVLSLAVSGKLVPQDKKDGTAEELYNQNINNTPEITLDEVPFEIPKSWKWVRLIDIAEIYNGDSINKQIKESKYSGIDKGYSYIATKDINRESHSIDYLNGIKIPFIEKNFKIAPKDSVLICSEGGNAGRKIGILDEDVCFGNKLITTIPINNINSKFIFFTFLSDYFQNSFQSKVNGLIGGISISNFKYLPIALPPLAEQKRIIGKLEELMKQLEELEIKKQKSDETCARLLRSAMQSLGMGESKIAFENLTELIKTPDDIKELESALLTLAVSGKLVQQDKKDGTGEDLYKKILVDFIKKEKEWSGRKKSTKKLSSISSEKISFDIPNSWKWVRLDELFLIERGGSPRPIESYITDDPEGLNWIKIGDTEKGGKYIYSTKEKIIKSGLKKSRMVYKGDLLLTNSMSFGRPYILKIDGCIHDGWLVLRPYSKNIDIDLFYYLLSSSLFSKQFADLVSGAVVKNLNADKVKSAIIPLPPLDEQKRIVEKIEEIMALINQLRDVVGGNKFQGRGRPKK